MEEDTGPGRDRSGEGTLTPEAYAAFTEALRARLEADPRVVGIASRELASRIRGFPSRAAEAVARRIEEP